jgi:exonuclease III
MGRFCSLTLLGRLGKRITIISAYQVPKNSGSRGKTTSHHQQVLQLKKDGDTGQQPRKHFCASLDAFIDNKITAGHQIILGGDFNEDVGLNLNGITRIIANHNLVHVMQSQLGANNELPTYARWSKRIDYIFMIADVAFLVQVCGAEPFNHRFFSDHRGLYADLRRSGLFDRNLSPLASPKYCDIRSSNPALIRKYITYQPVL